MVKTAIYNSVPTTTSKYTLLVNLFATPHNEISVVVELQLTLHKACLISVSKVAN